MNKLKISEDISIIVVDGKSVKIRNPYFPASSHDRRHAFPISISSFSSMEQE